MGVVAIDAEEVGPLSSLEIADALAMDARLPVPVNAAVALTAQPVGLGKINGFAVGTFQFVAVGGIMAIKAPLVAVVQDDVRMLFPQCSSFRIDKQTGVAVAAGKDPPGKRRRRGGKLVALATAGGQAETDHRKS